MVWTQVQYTNDTSGDICNHARSRFIELVSKVTLVEFMNQFNEIAEKVHIGDETDFYKQRGVKIHSLEVTGSSQLPVLGEAPYCWFQPEPVCK